jgi:hypothetical protein
VLGGIGRDVGSDKETGFLSMLGIGTAAAAPEAGTHELSAVQGHAFFLAKPELQHAADAVAF